MAYTIPAKKVLDIADGPKYAYIHIEPKKDGDATKPTFFLSHGFPSSAYDWRCQIRDLSAAGYGVIAPDMLGYGDTDKPAAIEDYALSKIAGHVIEILKHEGLTEVIGVGHDWGSALLSRMWNLYPQHFLALAFLSVPYVPPGKFDIDGINALTKAAFGYETYGYIYFFDQDDAAAILDGKTESALSLVYPDNSELHKTDLCPRDAVKAWLDAGNQAPLPSWISEAERKTQVELLQKCGWTGPTNWYKAVIRYVDAPSDAQIPRQNIPVTKPLVFAGGDIDCVTRPEMMQKLAGQGKQEGWLPTVEFELVKGAGHWLQLEQPEQVMEILEKLAGRLS